MVAHEEVAQTVVAKQPVIMDMVMTEEVVDWPELPQHMVEVAQTVVAKQPAIMDMVMTEEVEDWPELPQHMVELIMNKLMTPEISDYVRCWAVCTSWRTVFINHQHHPPPRPRPVTLPPFLIVPTPPSSTSCCSNTNKKKNKKMKGRVWTFSNKKKKKKKKKNKKMKRRVQTTNTKSLSFYNIIDKKVYNQFQVTILRNRYFRGSSHGWLVAVDQNYNNCEVRLFNPFLSSAIGRTRVINAGEILLPSLKDISIVIHETIDDHESEDEEDPSSYVYLRKAVLSADPLSNPIDYIVMAILGSPGRLAYCRPGTGNKVWTLVEFEYQKDWGFRDVIYCKDKFYALYFSGIVVVMDPTRNMMAVTLEIPRPRSRLLWHDTMYLVELAGCLFQVYRELEVGVEDTVAKRQPYSTAKFRVFLLEQKTTNKRKIFNIKKMNYEEEKEYGRSYEWKLVINLGGNTLFLGDNHSMWVRASDYPGCKPNSIYFTDDYIDMYHCKKWNGPHDLGVFNLVDGTIENHYPTNHNTPIWPVPIWIKPIVLADIEEKMSRSLVTGLSILPRVSK